MLWRADTRPATLVDVIDRYGYLLVETRASGERLHLPGCCSLPVVSRGRLGWTTPAEARFRSALERCSTCFDAEIARILVLSLPARQSLEELLRASDGRWEICGLLVGPPPVERRFEARRVAPLVSARRSACRFELPIAEFLEARRRAERPGQQVLALYHSHPQGDTRPSFRDRRLPEMTGLLSVILAQDGRNRIRVACHARVYGRLVPIGVEAG